MIDKAYMKFNLYAKEEKMFAFKHQILMMGTSIKQKTPFNAIVRISDATDQKESIVPSQQFIKDEFKTVADLGKRKFVVEIFMKFQQLHVVGCLIDMLKLISINTETKILDWSLQHGPDNK